MSVYVYASVCDFVCIALLLPFVLGFCLSVFGVFFSIVFSTCYHWWISFLVGWLSSFFLSFFFFYYFLIFNIFILITVFSFFLSFIFLPFILSCVDDRVLVLRPGIRPVPLRWESWVQYTGPSTRDLPAPCNIKKWKSPRDQHLNSKTQLYSTTSKLQCWTRYDKQLATQEYDPTH